MSQYAQYVDPKFSEQLMSESMATEDIPAPRKAVAAEPAPAAEEAAQ